MSNLHGFVQQSSVARASDGTSVGIRATRDGALVQVPWIQALCLEGRGFGTFHSAADLDATSVWTFGAGAIDADEFDWHLAVPDTAAVLPIFIQVSYSAIGTILTYGLTCAWGTGSAVSNGLALTEFNLRPGSSNASVCTATGITDDGGTALTETGFFWNVSKLGVTPTATQVELLLPPYSAATSAFVPVIEGARQVVAWTPGQAGTGSIMAQWIQLPIAAI